MRAAAAMLLLACLAVPAHATKYNPSDTKPFLVIEALELAGFGTADIVFAARGERASFSYAVIETLLGGVTLLTAGLAAYGCDDPDCAGDGKLKWFGILAIVPAVLTLHGAMTLGDYQADARATIAPAVVGGMPGLIVAGTF